jgi:F-type H+-transporting ATPase subunit b
MIQKFFNLFGRKFLGTGALALMVTLFWAFLAFASGGGGGEATHDSGAKVWDLIYRTVNFAILLAVLIILLRKPLKAGLNQRRENIRQELEELEQKKADLANELRDYEARLAAVKEERDKVIESYRREGEREKDKILENAKVLEQRILSQSRLTIQQELKKAKEVLRNDLAEESCRMAEALITGRIQESDHHALIGEYLAKVVKQ